MDWEDELEDMGLLMVVLSLIMVRQGAIYESMYFFVSGGTLIIIIFWR